MHTINIYQILAHSKSSPSSSLLTPFKLLITDIVYLAEEIDTAVIVVVMMYWLLSLGELGDCRIGLDVILIFGGEEERGLY